MTAINSISGNAIPADFQSADQSSSHSTPNDVWADWTPELKDTFEKNLASILKAVDPLDDEFFQLVDPTDI